MSKCMQKQAGRYKGKVTVISKNKLMRYLWKMLFVENLDDYLLHHNTVAALEVLQDNVKYISRETFCKTY